MRIRFEDWQQVYCMASHRAGETSNHHNPYSVLQAINPTTSFINQEGSPFDFGELEEAIVLQGVKINNDEAKASFLAARPAATLEMFPSWPLRFPQAPRGSSQSAGGSTDSGSAVNTLSSKAEAHLEPESPMASDGHGAALSQNQATQQAAKVTAVKRKGGATGSTSDKVVDAKTLRRLAQNREAARKSRLRKKAYVQQLESSRIKLAQLEQDLQRARAQGLLLGGSGGASVSSGATIFDMEYGRWLDDDHRHVSELRTALQAHLPDGDLRLMVDGYVAHYDEIFRLKEISAKSDVFHLITGMWTTPAERCFLWIGGFRPSELIKMLSTQIEPLTEQQIVGICGLQQSSQQAEEALSQGLEQLQQSLVDTIAGGSFNDGSGMHHMALAFAKLSNLEGFLRQADNLRQQTLHQLCRILTVRQAARCFLVIGEYYARLRALSSLWISRPHRG